MKDRITNVLRQGNITLAGVHSYTTKHRQMEMNP